jgi:hypothetical protein
LTASFAILNQFSFCVDDTLESLTSIPQYVGGALSLKELLGNETSKENASLVFIKKDKVKIVRIQITIIVLEASNSYHKILDQNKHLV